MLFGCASTSATTKVVSPSQLQNSTVSLDGRLVEVVGVLNLRPDAHNIFESKELQDELARRIREQDAELDIRSLAQYCLTISNPIEISWREKEFQSKRLVVSGVYSSHYLEEDVVDLGACPRPGALNVDWADFLNRYSDLVFPVENLN
ncbi:MAG TPA: hypothetical protein VMZ90_09680 [Vicinamibacterales bacterium]|nr:hypothetical protein [Vicinamibacterales bacterium]